jgi:hypothetical protein
MSLGILLEKMRRIHFGIDLSGRQRSVAEKLLDGAKIGTPGEKMGCEGMAQRILTLPMNCPSPSFTTVTIRSTANT